MLNRIVNLIGWLGPLLVLASVGVRLGKPGWDQYARYLAEGGLVCVFIYAAGQWREIAALFGHRQARYGGLAATSVLAVLGILVAVNYIGSKQNKRWDLTAAKQFSLSDQTKGVLSKLDAPLQIMVFAQEPEFPRFQDRLKEYQYSSKLVTAEYIDPDKKPAIARANSVQQYGTIIFNFKGRSERITSDGEQDLTNAIIKVVSGQQKKVYFTSGHGEKDTALGDRDGYNAISTALTKENYTVDKVVLAQSGSVPDDAAVLIVAGPKTDFFPNEITAIKTYLGKSGKLFLQLDPPDKPEAPALTNLIALAHEWGVDVGTNVVVDVSGMGRLIGTDASVPVAASYPYHPITQKFSYITAFPMARSVTPVEGGVDGHTAQTFVETSQRSWAETDIKALLTSGQVKFDADKGDKQGPIAIAAAVSSTPQMPEGVTQEPSGKPETRVVVFGDSDFATNATLGIQGNKDLFLNTVGWLSQQENLISIRPKEADDRRITMTASQQASVGWLSLLIIPGVIFALGVQTWWRRR